MLFVTVVLRRLLVGIVIVWFPSIPFDALNHLSGYSFFFIITERNCCDTTEKTTNWRMNLKKSWQALIFLIIII